MSMTWAPPASGTTFGKWTLRRLLGRGWQGEVWSATALNGDEAAIKLFAKVRPSLYARFRADITTLIGQGALHGVVPLLDHHLPERLGDERPWYVMLIGVPLVDDPRLTHPGMKAASIFNVARLLTPIHERGLSHRNIKPANLLRIDGALRIADWGLVCHPEESPIAVRREDSSPFATIAPEVREGRDERDGRPADVYSLAKTLWMLKTNSTLGFEGQYSPTGMSGSELRRGMAHLYPTFFGPLDSLLLDCTDDRPARRPTLSEFKDRLDAWMYMGTKDDD